MIPVIGAVTQTVPVVYKLERRDPRSGQLLTTWKTFRNRYEVGETVALDYGRKWEVVEVRNR
jgi:hypothetical protein